MKYIIFLVLATSLYAGEPRYIYMSDGTRVLDCRTDEESRPTAWMILPGGTMVPDYRSNNMLPGTQFFYTESYYEYPRKRTRQRRRQNRPYDRFDCLPKSNSFR